MHCGSYMSVYFSFNLLALSLPMWLSSKYGLLALFVRSCGVTVSGFIFFHVYQVCHNSTFWIIVISVDVHNDVLSYRNLLFCLCIWFTSYWYSKNIYFLYLNKTVVCIMLLMSFVEGWVVFICIGPLRGGLNLCTDQIKEHFSTFISAVA